MYLQAKTIKFGKRLCGGAAYPKELGSSDHCQLNLPPCRDMNDGIQGCLAMFKGDREKTGVDSCIAGGICMISEIGVGV